MTDLAASEFVSLTTFRRTGEPVPTTVWVAREDDALVVTTPAGSGKVKRLRRDPRVLMRPSSRLGKVDDGAPEVAGTARIVDDPEGMRRSAGVLRRKYGWQFRVAMVVEKLVNRGRNERVILRITPA